MAGPDVMYGPMVPSRRESIDVFLARYGLTEAPRTKRGAFGTCELALELEVELRRQLNQPRILGLQYPTEVRGTDIRVHPIRIKLGVVEQVKELKPELQAGLFGYGGVFVETPVKIRDMGSAQEVAARIAKGSWCLYGKIIGIEPVVVGGVDVVRIRRRVHERARTRICVLGVAAKLGTSGHW